MKIIYSYIIYKNKSIILVSQNYFSDFNKGHPSLEILQFKYKTANS